MHAWMVQLRFVAYHDTCRNFVDNGFALFALFLVNSGSSLFTISGRLCGDYGQSRENRGLYPMFVN